MFILPQFQFAKWRTAIATAIDTYFKYTSLLLKGDSGIVGSNGPTPTFLDSSTNNFSITRNGSVAQTSLNPFGPNGWSGYFNSATSDYLSVADNSALELGSGDFTIEMWINTTNSTQYSTIFARSPIAFGSGMMQIHMNNASSTSGDVALWLGDYNTSSYLMRTSGVSVRDGNWHHLAVVRSGNSWAMYVDGVSRATNTWSGTIADIAYGWVVGNDLFNTPRYYTGSISNLRIVKGLAVYTGAFTPPTAQLASTQSAGTNIAAITGTQTSLLTLQDSRFKDNSGNNFTITRTGSPKIQPFSPFAASASYVAGTYGGSGSFSVAGDYLISSATSSSLDLGSSDWTMECWVYFTSTSGAAGTILYCGLSNTDGHGITLYSTTNIAYYINGSVRITGAAPTLNTWTHLAAVRSSGTTTLYINGVSQGTTANAPTSKNYYYTSGNKPNYPTSNEQFFGYISNARIVKGLAVYTGAFTPPTSPVTTTSNGGAVGNNTAPTATQTSLLLNFANGGVMDGANKNAITINSNVAQGSFNPYSPNGWSGYFDSTSSACYVSTTLGAGIGFGTGDFTIEAWVYHTGDGDDCIISDNGACTFTYGAGGKLRFYTAGGTNLVDATTNFISNAWTHVAVVRSGGNITFYQNGVDVGPASKAYNITVNNGTTTYIGNLFSPRTGDFKGYISNLRVVKGTAVYTGAFTPPTAPLTAITNTSLLTLQSNRFKDNSTNNFTLTPTGSPQIQPVSPFASGIDYSPTVYGGSAYFDGSSRLNTTSTYVSVGSGDFTLESWIYPTAIADNKTIFDTREAANSTLGFDFALGSTNGLFMYCNGYQITGAALQTNTWYHVALVRSGNVHRIYLNGNTYGSALTASNNYTNTTAYIGGSYAGGDYFSGYISNLRVIKGTAVVPTSATLPTAPLSAVANTSLLLNFADGGVVDATGKNNVVTVSNAGVSLAQKKYGSGSYYFNGSTDGLSVLNKPYLNLSKDFTVEFWVNFTTKPAAIQTLCGKWGTTNYGWLVQVNGSTNTLIWTGGTGSGFGATITNSWTPSLSTWYHIAFVRSGTTITGYVNGTALSTTGTNNTDVNTSTSNVGVGINLDGNIQKFNGYIDDLRVTNGIARYTSNFTVPATHPTQ